MGSQRAAPSAFGKRHSSVGAGSRISMSDASDKVRVKISDAQPSQPSQRPGAPSAATKGSAVSKSAGDVLIDMPPPDVRQKRPPAKSMGVLTNKSGVTRARAAAAVGHTFLRRKKELEALTNDFAHLQEAFEPMEEFYFMRKDARPIHGLQNWDGSQWITAIENMPVQAVELEHALDIDVDANSPDRHSIASGNFKPLSEQIKTRLSESLSLSQWQAVWSFQNAYLNMEKERSQAGHVYYMTPELLSNMLFDRECAPLLTTPWPRGTPS